MSHAKWYAGPASAGSANGTSWANRVGSLTAAEALALVAGDDVIVGPGVYRETLTPSKAGGSAYSTGTVSVTNGSKTVTGSGTTFTGNVFVDGVFQITQLAHGTDGVTNGTGTFTSAAGNFQASMIGLTIRISTKIAAIISAVASTTSITITDPAGAAVAPAAGSGLTYDVGPESPYDIASVDSNTQITLADAWSGPTLTGESYTTWRPIRYIADVTGANTDGVGGIVRITGSNNDTTATRATCISTGSATPYRTFRGFCLDGVTVGGGSGTIRILNVGNNNLIFEDMWIFCPDGASPFIWGSGTTGVTAITVRRVVILASRTAAALVVNSPALDNSGCLFENMLFLWIGGTAVISMTLPGALIRDVICIGTTLGVSVAALTTVGQAVTVNNCIFSGCTTGVSAVTAGNIIEDYNSFFQNGTDRTNVTVGQHSNTNMPLFQPLPLLDNGRVEPWLPFSLMSVSGQRNLAGLFPPARDLYGTLRPQESNGDWGAVEALPQPVTNNNGGTNEYAIPGRGYIDFELPVLNGQTYTFTAGVRWDNNANVGVVPSMTLLADYGVAETSVSAVGTGSLETLTISNITPTINAAEPGGVMILRLKNNSTFASGINAYFSSVLGA